MNKIALVYVIIASVFYSCNCEKGSGKLKSQDFDLEPFNGIVVSGIATLNLVYSATPTLSVETDENLLPFIEIKYRKNNIEISTKQCVTNVTEMNINLSLPKFNYLKISGIVEVNCLDTFDIEKLEVIVSGTGDVQLSLNVQDLDSDISGAGNVELIGSALEHKLEISGSGSLSAFEFITKEADVEVSGSGKCLISVNDKLDAEVSGSGDIIYKGNPQKINTDASGSGKIRNEK